MLSSGSPGSYEGYTGNTWYATAHPETFIATTNATSYDWYYGAGAGNGASYRNDELWGNPLGYNAGQTTTKTLFDPCPPGWVVPHPYVFTAFTTTGSSAAVSSGDVNVSGSFLQGWNFLYDGTNTTFIRESDSAMTSMRSSRSFRQATTGRVRRPFRIWPGLPISGSRQRTSTSRRPIRAGSAFRCAACGSSRRRLRLLRPSVVDVLQDPLQTAAHERRSANRSAKASSSSSRHAAASIDRGSKSGSKDGLRCCGVRSFHGQAF